MLMRTFAEEAEVVEAALSCVYNLCSPQAVLCEANQRRLGAVDGFAATVVRAMKAHGGDEPTIQEWGCQVTEVLAEKCPGNAAKLEAAGMRQAVETARDLITNERNLKYPGLALAALDAALKGQAGSIVSAASAAPDSRSEVAGVSLAPKSAAGAAGFSFSAPSLSSVAKSPSSGLSFGTFGGSGATKAAFSFGSPGSFADALGAAAADAADDDEEGDSDYDGEEEEDDEDDGDDDSDDYDDDDDDSEGWVTDEDGEQVAEDSDGTEVDEADPTASHAGHSSALPPAATSHEEAWFCAVCCAPNVGGALSTSCALCGTVPHSRTLV
jgi:hypothetical protein